MQLHQNELWTISYDEAVSSVKIDWTEKTAHMTDADFKDALSRFAGHAEEHSARCLLVDVQRFKHSLSEAIGQWRDTVIVPRYNAVGIQKMGYIVGPNAQLPPAQDPPAQDPPAQDAGAEHHQEQPVVAPCREHLAAIDEDDHADAELYGPEEPVLAEHVGPGQVVAGRLRRGAI